VFEAAEQRTLEGTKKKEKERRGEGKKYAGLCEKDGRRTTVRCGKYGKKKGRKGGGKELTKTDRR